MDAENFNQIFDDLVDEKWVAKAIDRSVQTLRNDRSGRSSLQIPFLKIGGRVRYRKSEISEWLLAKRVVPVKRDPRPRQHRGGRPKKSEQLEAIRLGVTVTELRCRKFGSEEVQQ